MQLLLLMFHSLSAKSRGSVVAKIASAICDAVDAGVDVGQPLARLLAMLEYTMRHFDQMPPHLVAQLHAKWIVGHVRACDLSQWMVDKLGLSDDDALSWDAFWHAMQEEHYVLNLLQLHLQRLNLFDFGDVATQMQDVMHLIFSLPKFRREQARLLNQLTPDAHERRVLLLDTSALVTADDLSNLLVTPKGWLCTLEHKSCQNAC